MNLRFTAPLAILLAASAGASAIGACNVGDLLFPGTGGHGGTGDVTASSASSGTGGDATSSSSTTTTTSSSSSSSGFAKHCENGLKDADETDVDCGGPSCLPCADGQVCAAPSDCASTFCEGGVCCNQGACNGPCSSCSLKDFKGICKFFAKGYNASPSSPECPMGGACDGFGMCSPPGAVGVYGASCMTDGGCMGNHCKGGFCKLKNGDVCFDNLGCGSGLCKDGICQACQSGPDCQSGSCSSGTCKLPGGSPCNAPANCAGNMALCTNGLCGNDTVGMCTKGSDCGSGFCSGTICMPCNNNTDCGGTTCVSMTTCLKPQGAYCDPTFDQCNTGLVCNTVAGTSPFPVCTP